MELVLSDCVFVLFPAASTSSSSIHESSASLHISEAYDLSLCRGYEPDRYHGNHEWLFGESFALAWCD